MKNKYIDSNESSVRRLNFSKLPEKLTSYDEATRSIGVVISSDAPVLEYDPRIKAPIPTVILPEGVQVRHGQVCLKDEHNMTSTSKIHGSVRDISIEEGEEHKYLVGRAYFAEDQESDVLHGKMRDRHITDVSIHVDHRKTLYLQEGETAEFHGRSYTGRMRIVVESELIEVSATGMGADPNATTRSHSGGEEQAQTKGVNMNKSLRNKLLSLGLSEDATDEQAWEFLKLETTQRALTAQIEKEVDEPNPPKKTQTQTQTPKEPAKPKDDIIVQAEDTLKTERSRVKSIRCLGFQFEARQEIIDQCIDEGKDLEESLELITEDCKTKRNLQSDGHVYFLENQGMKRFKKDAADAIIMRHYGPDWFKDNKLEATDGARNMRFLSLQEITRSFLANASMDLNPGTYGQEHIKRAMSTSDFADIFETVADTILLNDYAPETQTWRQWCAIGSVTNFKIHETVRISEFNDLDELPEGGEYKYGTVEGHKERFRIFTFGKAFRVTRQTIINDDVEAIASVPRGMRRSTDRTLESLAYAELLSNPTLSDGNPLIHPNNKNIATKYQMAPNIDSLDEMELLMGDMRDLKGLEILDLSPGYILLPKELKKSTETFFRSKSFVEADTSATRENIYHGSDLVRIYSSRLSQVDKFAWYMLERSRELAVKMYFLNGVQTPFFDRRESFNTDAMEWKVRIDAGAAAPDPRGVIYNKGRA